MIRPPSFFFKPKLKENGVQTAKCIVEGEVCRQDYKMQTVVYPKVRQGVELLPLRQKIFSGWYNRVAVKKLAGISSEKQAEIYEELLKFRKEIQGQLLKKTKLHAEY